LLKQGHLELIAQDHVQVAFECLQGQRLHIISGQPVLVLSHPRYCEVFSDVKREPPEFQPVPVASFPITEHY